jgi:hypothetical protein
MQFAKMSNSHYRHNSTTSSKVNNVLSELVFCSYRRQLELMYALRTYLYAFEDVLIKQHNAREICARANRTPMPLVCTYAM